MQFRDRLLIPLGPRGDRRYVTAVLDQNTDTPIPAPEERVAPTDTVAIIDGVFLIRPEVNDFWDFRVFLEVEPDVAYLRGVLRDAAWIGSEERARERYELRYIPAERRYLEQVRPHEFADVVIENTHPERRLFRWR
jgi:uridine kinase